MTEFQTAFLELMAARDLTYLHLFFIVAGGLLVVYVFLRKLFKLALSLALVVFVAAWAWGMWQLFYPGGF